MNPVMERFYAGYEDDLALVLRTGAYEERKAAFLRLLGAAFNAGWDDCEQVFTEALAEAAIRFSLPPQVHRA